LAFSIPDGFQFIQSGEGSNFDEATRFRKQAEEARQHAEKAISPLDKEAWLRVAGEWIKLA
jgi:hypothetical protein